MLLADGAGYWGGSARLGVGALAHLLRVLQPAGRGRADDVHLGDAAQAPLDHDRLGRLALLARAAVVLRTLQVLLAAAIAATRLLTLTNRHRLLTLVCRKNS
jgi:hypothetical protein